MKREQIIAAIRRQQALIQAEGVTAVYLFGSQARGNANTDSDVDVFVDYDRSIKGYFSLLELIGVQQIIEDELGLPVDVIVRGDMKAIRDGAENDAIRVF